MPGGPPFPGSKGTAAPPGQASEVRTRRQHGETSIWLAGNLTDGVLVSIDNCDRVESLSALPRRLPGVLP
jgi:hypothetical protein